MLGTFQLITRAQEQLNDLLEIVDEFVDHPPGDVQPSTIMDMAEDIRIAIDKLDCIRRCAKTEQKKRLGVRNGVRRASAKST